MGDPKLPFFVYGTLLEGFHNHDRLLKPHSPKHTPAVVEGPLVMFHLGVFPGVVDAATCKTLRAHHPELAASTGRIRGELVHVDDAVYESVRARLDMLEGYSPADDDNLYDRVKVRARVLKRTGSATVAGVTAEAATTVAVVDAAPSAAAGGAAAMPSPPATTAAAASAAPSATDEHEKEEEEEHDVVDAWMYIMSDVAFATMRTSRGVAHVPDGDWGRFERARRAAAAATVPPPPAAADAS